MWPTWPIVGFNAASPVSTRLPPCRAGGPAQAEPRLVVGEELLDADLPDHAVLLVMRAVRRDSRSPPVREQARVHRLDGGGELLAEPLLARTSARARTGAAGAARSPAREPAARIPAPPACHRARRTGSAARAARRRPAPRLQPLDPAVWNRDTLAQSGRAQLLACGEAVEHDRLRAMPELRLEQAPRPHRTAASFEPTSRSSRMFALGRSSAIWFIAGRRSTVPAPLDALQRPDAIYASSRSGGGVPALVAACTLRSASWRWPAAFPCASHLAVELVDEHVDRRVHVRLDRLGVDVLAAHVQVDLDLAVELVHRNTTFTSITWSKCRVTRSSLRDDVIAERGRDVEMVAAEVEVHRALLPLAGDVLRRGRAGHRAPCAG